MKPRFVVPFAIIGGRSPGPRGRNWLVMNGIMHGMQFDLSRMPAAGVSEDEADFDAALKRIAKPQAPAAKG
jgi:hypothetical protein